MFSLSKIFLTYTAFFFAISGTTSGLIYPKDDTTSPMVTLEDGEVLGTVKVARNKTVDFAAFMGMPYAQPPIGDLRFKRPVPNDPWTEVFDASKDFTDVCPQPFWDGTLDPRSTEDCLKVNVYSPELPSEANPEPNLPVMFYIHGGSFSARSGNIDSFGPEFIMDYGVVLVMADYRLGQLGFIATGSPDIAGNQGLWDQNLALKWTQKNIRAFGGDPNKVTIFGESAGSWAVYYHMLSPHSTGLFHQLIAESGTPMSPSWSQFSPERATTFGKQIQEKAGCDHFWITDKDKCMREDVTMETLISIEITDGPFGVYPVINNFNAVIDKDLVDDPFLPDDPEVLMATGNFNKDINVMHGVTKDEALLLLSFLIMDPNGYQQYKDGWGLLGPLGVLDILGSEVTGEDTALAYELLSRYIGDIDNFNPDHFENITNLFSDSYFWYGTYRMTNFLLENDMKAYQYKISYKGKYSFMDFYGVDASKLGVCHADELFYLFQPCYEVYVELPDYDVVLSKQLLSYWTNFAKFGDPTPPESGSQVTWTALTKEDRSYLNFDVPISKMEYGQDWIDRMAIWDELWSPEARKTRKKNIGTFPSVSKDKGLFNVLESWKNMKTFL